MEPIVFVVDDDAVLLFTLQGILRAAGYPVEAFDGPVALLTRLLPSDRGCVVLDLKMPGLSGLELQRTLHERGVTMPMVFVSGRADIPDAVTAMKQGAVDFLPKPVDPDALLRVIAQALSKDGQSAAERTARERAKALWVELSQREQDVCHLSAQGLLNKQIAAKLGTTESTVQAQRARAWKKLGIGSPAELIRILAQLGAAD